jgi:hypothetical protein
MSDRDIEQLRRRLRNVRLESQALRLEEEALVARIAIEEEQGRVNVEAIDRPLAIDDRVHILNPGINQRRPGDIVGTIINITRHFVTVRTDTNLIIRRAPHNVERINVGRVVL